MRKLTSLISLGAFALGGATTATAAGPCCAPPGAPTAQATMVNNPGSAATEHPLIAHYTALSEAMVMDDLAQTQQSARALAESSRESKPELAKLADELAQSDNLNVARERLIPLSQAVIKLAEGKEGYFVMQCPMVKGGEWLQTDRNVRNPYMGQRMIRCGTVKRTTAG